MTLDYLLIGITVLHLGIIGVYCFEYKHFRNIYTQKILFLNETFSGMSAQLIIEYRISGLRSFTITIQGEEPYPPSIKEAYLVNPEYKALTNELNARRLSLEKMLKKIILTCVILLVAVSVIYVVS